MRVVDFRARPRTPELVSMYHYEGSRYGRSRAVGSKPLPVAAPLEEFIKEMDEAGVSVAVFMGRDLETLEGWKLPNDHVADVARQYPDRIVGFAGIDPHKGGRALREIDRAVDELGLRGVSIDPGKAKLDIDDRRWMYPIYEACAKRGIPVAITCGPGPASGGYMTQYSPLAVDRVAADIPELKVVASHAGWPFTSEMIAAAWRHPNLFFENSVYHHMPGAELVVQAANTIIADKVLYASAYPIAALNDALDSFKCLPFSPESLRRVLYTNAAQLLGLETDRQSP